MLEVTLVGCGATMPLPNRATAVAAVKYKGQIALLDCGEGTQAAARRAGVSLVKIRAICLTHYHGDHVLGLPGLLSTMGNMGRTEPVLLMGPAEGYDEMISLLLKLAGELPFAVEQRPLDLAGDRQDLWDGLVVTTCALKHRIACNGYRFDLPRAGRFLPEKAEELCVPRALWGQLQKHKAVLTPAGEVVQPEQVLSAPRSGLSVVYATDTSPCAALPGFARNTDLLICDATYACDDYLDRAALYGHSTFPQCGKLAAQAHAKRLWLTHFGGGLTDPEAELHYAQDFFPQTEAGFDGKTIRLNFED